MSNSQLEDVIGKVTDYTRNYTDGLYFYVSIGIGTIALVIPCLILLYLRKQRVLNETAPKRADVPKVRFRKRDRIQFFTKKMIRKVKELKDEIIPGGEEYENRIGVRRKRKSSSALHSRFSRLLSRQDSESIRMMKEPPASLLEADISEFTESNSQLPAEVMYMLRSVRVFGHFEQPLFFELCKHIVTKSLPTGKVLFRPGAMEECIYIVQSGQLNLYIVDKKGTEMLLKNVKAGENIHSVMNILDAIRGVTTYKYSILIRAAADSQILMLPSMAFKRVFENHPEALVRIVQIVMLRLQQVTFQAFHQFLGLSTELISTSSARRVNQELKSLSIYSLGKPKDSVSSHKMSDLQLSPSRLKSGLECVNRNISSIVEESSEEYIQTLPNGEMRRIRRTNSLNTEEVKQSPGKSAHIPIKRTGSHGRLVNLYANGGLNDTDSSNHGSGGSISDFDNVLGRVGLDNMRSNNDTVDDDSPTNGFDFPKAMFQLASDVDLDYGLSQEDEEKMLAAARADLVKLLNLSSPKLLDFLSIDVVPQNTYLIRHGDKESSLLFLVQGTLEVSQHTANNEPEVLFTCVPGEFMGSLSLLTGDPSFFTIRATELSYVVIISKEHFYNLIKEEPKIVLPVANTLTQKMSSFVRNIDFALDWKMLESGKALFRQNEDADSLSIVLNGRLRSVRALESGKKAIGDEYGRGEFVGLVEVLTQAKRTSTVHAVRDTELAQIPEGLLNTIKLNYPQIVSRLIQLLGERILGNAKKPGQTINPDSKLEMVGHNLGTVAIIPTSNAVPLANFTFELGLAINNIGPALVLTSSVIKKRFGHSVWDSVHEYNLSNWLGHQEDTHRMVVYQADMHMSEWTKRCIRQADIILIVGLGDDEPTVGKLEAQLETMTSVRAQKDLILLYDEETFKRPTQTIEWLNARGWISSHHHVRCPRKIFRRRLLSERYATDTSYVEPSRTSDFARLARCLTGTSIGLVLGGGGARGISHVGIIKALHEAGVPIDSVGGCSFGALIGALYAEDGNIVRTTQRAREVCYKMSSMWRKLLDMTYPHTSLFTGKAFNAEIESTFGDLKIEDMLLPYFCNTTDISISKMKIHQTGGAWRYVRASMSLSGYLPPICDPADGNLLLDGGYVNNLPADVMRTLGVKTIIAVDVGSLDDTELTNYGDSLSGWWMLWKRWNPFSSHVRIPDLAGIQSRLAYVSCVQQLEEVKNGGYAHYIRPPIDRFKTLQFGSFDEIMDVGFHHGKAVIGSLLQGNVIPGSDNIETMRERKIITGGSLAPSFTALTELVSKIKAPAGNSRLPRYFDYFSDEDMSDAEGDGDEVDMYGRGTFSDQDLMPESDFMSGTEELGYESEDLTNLRKRVLAAKLSNEL